jgi:DNA-binding NtrC family response regulator
VSKTILVVDDDFQMRKLYEDFLPMFVQGYDLVIKADGSEALAYVEAGGTFDVLVTDRKMPTLCGDVLISTLRERGFTQPMFLATGCSGDHSWCGATAVLQKPFDIRDLKGLIAQAA